MADERDKMILEPASRDDADTLSNETANVRPPTEPARTGMNPSIDATAVRSSPVPVATEPAESAADAPVGRPMSLVQRINNAIRGASGAIDPQRAVAAVARHPVPAVILGVAASAIVARTLSRSRNGTAEFRADRYRYRIGRQLLFGTCASVACWGAWKARRPAKKSDET
jgi:hypothetical protein